jgi:mRNA-degrading endonuclease toxin of MazEF toxin-antitoxin module
MKAGDVAIINLDPALGHEQRGTRPFLVLSDPRLPVLVIGVPLTTAIGRAKRPTAVQLSPIGGKPSIALCDQIRSVDAARIQRVVGSVNSGELLKVRKVIARLIGI